MIPDGEQPGSMTSWIAASRDYRRKALGLVMRPTSFTGWRQYASLGLGVELVDRLRGRRERHDGATQVPEAKIETYFAISKHAGTSSPGAINPIEKRRSGRSELGRRETSGSSSQEWRKPKPEARTENAGWRLDR